MNADQMQAEIDKLIPKAESGEQWAEICRLEAEMIAARFREAGVPVESIELRYPDGR